MDRSLSTVLLTQENSLEFRDFDKYPNEDFYFFAPASYLGNRLGSYGGNLNFNIRFEGPYTTKPKDFKRLQVRLSGNGITLVYIYPRFMDAFKNYNMNILIVEDDFKKVDDNSRIDRETLLMVLANLDSLSISANFLDKQYSVILSQISLDHAERAGGSDRKALAVETCDCPVGYTGKSCEVNEFNFILKIF